MRSSHVIRWALTALLLVLPASAGHAKPLAPLRHVDFSRPGSMDSSRLTTDATRALIRGDFRGAISLADRAVRFDPRNAWAYYVKGEALVGVGEGREGVVALGEAIARYQPQDLWGRSVALWGRARALEMIGQCEQARRAFDAYEALVQRRSPRNADQAKKIAGHCTPGAG